MVLVRGPTYRSGGRSTTSCNPGRVICSGPTYVRRPWYPSIFRPYPYYSSVSPLSPVIVDPCPQIHTVHHSSGGAAGIVALAVSIIALVAIASAVSISRDCHFIGTDCHYDIWSGAELCNDLYDCKW
jgi:hypothetical protein